MSRSYVAAKQMTGLWKAVTVVERKFYHSGFSRVAEAQALVQKGLMEEAEKLMTMPLPRYVRPAVDIVRANMHGQDEGRWLQHLNQYLEHFDQAPVGLAPGSASRLHGLTTLPLPEVNDGPLISVIMAAHNAASTIGFAIDSILRQTWQRLELIIVDDASSDDTWREIQKAVARDSRVKALRNRINSGPYVCKNIALHLGLATGDFITCHDADDWAHPQRLAQHMKMARANSCLEGASLTLRLRMTPQGEFARIGEPRSGSPDGVANVATPSCLFHRDLLMTKLGSWDCVRFGGDSEIISRTEYFLRKTLPRLKSISMISLEASTSLSGSDNFAARVKGGLSPTRQAYKTAYEKWHGRMGGNAFMPFPPDVPTFERPEVMRVPMETINRVLRGEGELGQLPFQSEED